MDQDKKKPLHTSGCTGMKQEPKQIIEIAKKIAKKKRIKDFELWFRTSSSISVKSENGEIKISPALGISKMGIRIIKNKRIGYAGTERVSSETLELAFDKALEKTEKTYLSSFESIAPFSPKGYAHPNSKKALNNPKILKDVINAITKEALRYKKIETFTATSYADTSRYFVYTLSSDEPIIWESTVSMGSLSVNSIDFEVQVERGMEDWEVFIKRMKGFLKRYKKKTIKPQDIDAGKKEIEVILHPYMFSLMLRTILFEHLYITAVDEGYGRFKIGDECASRKITIYDNGVETRFVLSSPVDDEGVPSRINKVIEKGVLKMFLFDRETAVKHERDSTGNGIRRPILTEDKIEAPVRPTVRALVVEPGRKSLEEMIKKIKKGVLIKAVLGFHTANKITGDFSNTILSGYVIEKGEIKGMAEPGAWGVKGNVFEILRNIKELSKKRLMTGDALLPYAKTEIRVV